jgi:hypothetical protein
MGQGGWMKKEDFLLEDYKLKVEYYAGHLSRMWTRFNFLLTINSALFGLFATREPLAQGARREFLLIGLVLSVAWLVFGVLDISFTRRYTKHIERAYGLLVNRVNGMRRRYPYAGQAGTLLRYVSPLSMAILAPLGFLVVWLLEAFN